jgi:hypothetical protein
MLDSLVTKLLSPSFRRRPESRKTSVTVPSCGAGREGRSASCQMVPHPGFLLDSGLRRNDGESGGGMMTERVVAE